MSTSDTIKTGSLGLSASGFTWLAGIIGWYSTHLNEINAWLIHVAQLGGIVVMIYTILILRRNWKNGSNSRNPLD